MLTRPLALLLALALGLAGPAAIVWAAQPGFYATAPDLGAYATKSSVAALQAAMPAPCPGTQLADTLNGTVGSGTPCTVRVDAARPTVVQAAIVTTDASGNWSVTWAKAFANATPYINPQAINTGTQPYICNVSSSTTTGATGRCWQTVTSTLPSLATSLLGLVINPTSAAASIQVRVAAREPTQ